MKECFAITTYCNTDKKIKILDETIDNLKKFGLDIMIHAHYPLNERIQSKVDFYFYSSNNPVLFTRWNFSNFYYEAYILELKMYDFSYTALKGWSEIIEILKIYDKIHIINYDSNISEELFQLSKKFDKSLFLKNLSDGYYNVLYFCLKQEDFSYFSENITLEKWLNFKPSKSNLPIAEEFLPTFIHGQNFLEIENYDYNKLAINNISADDNLYYERLHDFLTLENNRLLIGNLNRTGYLSVLFFSLSKPIQVDLYVDDKNIFSKNLINDYFFVSNEYKFQEIGDHFKIKINNNFVDKNLIKRFLYHDAIIFKENK